jgi:glyoxylase-like metal-dependent hydrolase (beta-lactamase superfamily II)/ferredoxin
MADLRKKLTQNVDGLFFVDSTCIDCDTCRQLAPEVFTDIGNYSVVFAQPQTDENVRAALRSLIACPTGSIGTTEKMDLAPVMRDLPMELEPDIYYNGFTSPDSYGATSYFIRHPQGNWMIDSPKWMPHLRDRFREMGGLRYISLTHRDDVADADRYAQEFGAERIIHRLELSAQPDAERVLDGFDPMRFASDFLIIPTPGHTRGSCVLLYKNEVLFTGDHLWWSRNRNGLSASRSVAWYSWNEQVKSLRLLQQYNFRAVYPGHGERKVLTSQAMSQELSKLIQTIEGRGY